MKISIFVEINPSPATIAVKALPLIALIPLAVLNMSGAAPAHDALPVLTLGIVLAATQARTRPCM